MWLFNSICAIGSKKSLEVQDLFALEDDDTSAKLVPAWNLVWNEAMQEYGDKNKALKLSTELDDYNEMLTDDVTDMTPLIDDGKGTSKTTSSKKMSSKRQKTIEAPSIILRLIFIFKWDIVCAMTLKLLSDILTFANPILLKNLIQFTETPAMPLWYGLSFAAAMFVASECSSLLLNHYYFLMYRVGTRLQSILTSAVYRKTMKLSNASRREKTVGEIVNLMAIDIDRFQQICPQIQQFWSTPFQIGLALVLLWEQIGVAVFSGVAVMFLLLPINFVITMQTRKYQVRQMYFKDERTKMVNEVLNGIKVIKLYAWEIPMERTIVALRNRELSLIRKAAILRTFSDALNTASPFLVALSTFATYILADPHNVLTPQIAFVSLTLFNQLRMPMSTVAELISQTVQVNVSNKRLKDFLVTEELENYVEHTPKNPNIDEALESVDFSASWDKNEPIPTLRNLGITIPRGGLIAVVGKVGAGKSSLLYSLLGEMERVGGRVGVYGTVAYAPQQAWMQNESVRNNITFGMAYDEYFYSRVMTACALYPDMHVLAHGDQTEIGEKGINLSGGQKSRISLARAVYQNHDIYLLDDPLSAVDNHVGADLFSNVIGPDGMLRNKTRILVTHELSYLRYTDLILIMADGAIVSKGTYKELMSTGALARLVEECKTEQEERGERDENEEEDIYVTDDEEEAFHDEDATNFDRLSMRSTVSGIVSRRRYSSNKHKHQNHRRRLSTTKSVISSINKDPTSVRYLTGVEKLETGRVKLAVYINYFKAMGLGFSILFVFGMVSGTASSMVRNIWLTNWSNDNKNHNGIPSVDISTRLSVYAAIGFTEVFLTFFGMVALLFGGKLASLRLHAPLLHAIFRAPMHFFDTTPFGRILNRVGKDIETVDFLLPYNVQFFFQCVLQVVSTLSIIMFTTPIFCIVIVPLAIMYLIALRYYIATSRQLKRLESVTRSPIYSHLSESIHGASTIRAYKLVPKFSRISEQKVDTNVQCRYLNNVANRWLAIRLEFIGNCVVLFAALFAALNRGTTSAGLLGLSVSYAFNITFVLNFAVRQISKLESNIVSVERIMEYSDTRPEAAWDSVPAEKGGVQLPKNWPHAGRILFENYSTRYRAGMDLVVRQLNADIHENERIGIVGRTGAGKSSLTLALFRMIEPTAGRIVIDGIDISQIGLHDLRANITIIPQDPVLFSGTLRFNLDPFGRYSDAEIWNALELAHLKTFANTLAEGLDHQISEGGSNISLGQKQLVCLARALLRRSKILVLDEATAAVDLTTDALIQETIRREFIHSTVITIAHRLNTIIDYNRVMVLERGEVMEFDSPQTLLAKPTSLFAALAEDAKSREAKS